MIEDRDGGDDGMRPEDAMDCQEPERTPKVTSGAGNRKPPLEHQFKKGVSGNPKGRPKRKKQEEPLDPLKASSQLANRIFMDEVYRLITFRQGSETIEMPALRVIYRQMTAAAVNGNRSAQRWVVSMVQSIENSDRESRVEYVKAAIEYKCSMEQMIAHNRASGRAYDEPIPHPDDIILDMANYRISINGPSTPEQKAAWDQDLAFRDGLQLSISNWKSAHKKARYAKTKESHLANWILVQLTYDRLNDDLPKRYRKELRDRYWYEGGSRPGSQQTRVWPGEEGSQI